MFIPSQQQQCWLEAVPDVLRAAGHLGRLLWLEPAGPHQLAAAQGAAAEGVLLPGRGVSLQVSCQHRACLHPQSVTVMSYDNTLAHHGTWPSLLSI